MKVALDTNILAYAEGVNDADRRARAIDLLARAPAERVVVPVQVLGELYNVLTRKAGRTRAEARKAVLDWSDAYAGVETTNAVMLTATELASDRQIGVWDAVIVAAAAHAGCRLLLSEDMADGFTWSGVTVANPFADNPHRLLVEFLGEKGS